MALQEYVKRVITALTREDGALLESCLSISPQAIPGGQRLLESRLSDADVEAACSGGGRDPVPPVVAQVCKEMLLYLQAVKNEDAKLAFQHYRGAYRVFVEDSAFLGLRGGQSGWLLPTLASMSRGVMVLAKETAVVDDKAQTDVTSLLHTAFSSCLRDRSTDPVESKKLMAMHMAVVLFKHCFKINSLKTCQGLSKNVRGGTGDAESLADRADVVGFLYYEGITLMRFAANDQQQLSDAEKTLTRALKECHCDATGNRRRILAKLAPLRMRMGCLPERGLLEKHDLLIFDDFCTSIRRGDLKRFSLLMEQHDRALELSDLRTHMEDCRLLVYRQVIKMIVAATGEHFIPLNVVKLGFVLKGHEFQTDQEPPFPGESAEDRDVTRYDELKNTLAALIKNRLISGVVRSKDGKLQLSKKAPFPPLPGRSNLGRGPSHRRRRTSASNAFSLAGST
ncbi:unnamed protein product [Pylaiella littoralis]